jgi:hypothetical protein
MFARGGVPFTIVAGRGQGPASSYSRTIIGLQVIRHNTPSQEISRVVEPEHVVIVLHVVFAQQGVQLREFRRHTARMRKSNELELQRSYVISRDVDGDPSEGTGEPVWLRLQ